MPFAEEQIEKYSGEKAWEVFDGLPDALKDAILSPQNLDVLDDIAKKHNVPPETNLLVRYTHAALAGIIPLQKFRQALQEELQIPEDQARQIAREIREKIFTQVSEELRKLHNLP